MDIRKIDTNTKLICTQEEDGKMTEKKEEVNYVPECQKEEGEVEIPVNELKEDKYDKRYKKRLKEKGLLKKSSPQCI